MPHLFVYHLLRQQLKETCESHSTGEEDQRKDRKQRERKGLERFKIT